MGVLCPWGLGERTACDEHAVLAGAVLLKPNTDYVEAVPDFYRDGVNYLALNTNFSDLPEKMEIILRDKDGEVTALRQRAYQVLRNGTHTTLARDFWSKLRGQVG